MTPLSRGRELDLVDTEGRLERHGDWSSWGVPQVRLEGDALLWWPETVKTVRAAPGLLERFVTLGDDASGKRIATYASRWGVLGICEHDVPCSHNPPPWDSYGYYLGNHTIYGGQVCRPVGWENLDQGDPALERLEHWRNLARGMRALLTIAAYLQAGELPPAHQWGTAFQGPLLSKRPGEVNPSWRRSLLADGRQLAEALSELLGIGDVRLSATVLKGRPAVTLGGPGLFGALAIQMLMAASSSDSYYFCHSCGRPFALIAPRRRPQAGRHHYCPQCGDSAARRDASRRYRERKKAARSARH